MMPTEPILDLQARRDQASTVLARFFDVPNALRLADTAVVGEGCRPVPGELLPAIERYRAGHRDRPLLLPWWQRGRVHVTWYACGHDVRALRSMEAELEAFVGSVYATRDLADASDPLDPALEALKVAGLYVQRLRSTIPDAVKVAQQWALYWRVLDWQPPRPFIEVRSFAQLRAAFDRALLARNERSALEVMATLREVHGLSAENRAFLDIRLAAALGRWDDILAHRQLPQVLQLRMPPETYGDIWEALYEVHLRPREVRGALPPLLEAFEEQVRVTAAPLLRALGPSRRPAALKGFVLHELSQVQPSEALLADLLHQLGPQAFGTASAAVADRVRQLAPQTGAQEGLAESEMQLERYEQAYTLLWPLPDSARVLTLLLACTREIEDPERAFGLLGRLEASIQAAEVRQARPKLLGAVQALAARRVTPETRPATVPQHSASQDSLAQNDVVTWWREQAHSDRHELLERQDLVDRLVTDMEDHALEGGASFEALLPVWFEWVVDRTPPASRLVRVYQVIIEALYARDQLGDSELEMIRRAAACLLDAGPTPVGYAALLQRLCMVFEQVRSPRTLDWALDIADALALTPCRNAAARADWLAHTMDAALGYHERLNAMQRARLRLLAQEAGLDATAFADSSRAVGGVAAEGPALRVLVYSLDGPANQRAAITLRALLPACRIETSEDETCTAQLHTYARTADLVAFVAAVAKHQAFFCIKNAIRASDALVQVRGSGTTRIVQAVIERLQEASNSGILPVFP